MVKQQASHLGIRIGRIAERPRLFVTRGDTRRRLALGQQVGAEITFLHHTAFAGGRVGIDALDVGTRIGEVEAARAIRALLQIDHHAPLPWAVGIHTVTAFIFSGFAFWMTPLLAPRFLASAFTSGPALLILLLSFLRRIELLDPGEEAIRKLGRFVTYCLLINVFFVLVAVFTAFHSCILLHMKPIEYLLTGLNGRAQYSPRTWLALALLLVPVWRTSSRLLSTACAPVFVSVWLDKGLLLRVGGFAPSPMGTIARYTPTLPEWEVVFGIWAFRALLITVLYKITLSVRVGANNGARQWQHP